MTRALHVRDLAPGGALRLEGTRLVATKRSRSRAAKHAAPRAGECVVALRTLNPLNRREHHHARAKRVAHERAATLAALRAFFRAPPALPALGSGRKLLWVLTRLSPGTMDSDGAVAAMKGVRDAVAEFCGVDDADPRVAFHCGQDAGDAVGVRIVARPDATPCDCVGGWRCP
jgi:hypothetical protein